VQALRKNQTDQDQTVQKVQKDLGYHKLKKPSVAADHLQSQVNLTKVRHKITIKKNKQDNGKRIIIKIQTVQIIIKKPEAGSKTGGIEEE
jgi:hypothetical protein